MNEEDQVAKTTAAFNISAMFDAALYGPYYHHFLLVVTAITALVYLQERPTGGIALGYNTAMDWIVGALFISIIGTRPVSGMHFVDMSTYAVRFEMAAYGNGSEWGDAGFDLFTRWCASVTDTTGYFVICAALYFTPVAIASRIIHGRWGFATLLAFAGGFSFFSFGVNGIRSGIAGSFLILAYAARKHRFAMLLMMAAAASIHKSAALPAAAFIVAGFYNNPWAYATVWSAALAASITLGESLSLKAGKIASLGDEERLAGYIAKSGFGDDKGGFRLDFVLYSIVPVAISYALTSANSRKDLFYRRLICTYLLANSAWLCLMYAAFSNRFAYLSWFMMPWVVIYPFIPKPIEGPATGRPEPARLGMLAAGLIAHFSFTYIMLVYVYPGRS